MGPIQGVRFFRLPGTQGNGPGQRAVGVLYLDQCLFTRVFKAAFLTDRLSITHVPKG